MTLNFDLTFDLQCGGTRGFTEGVDGNDLVITSVDEGRLMDLEHGRVLDEDVLLALHDGLVLEVPGQLRERFPDHLATEDGGLGLLDLQEETATYKRVIYTPTLGTGSKWTPCASHLLG